MQVELMYDKLDVLLWLVITGVTFGVMIMVIMAFAKMGWKLAPYILVISFVVWMLN